MQRRTPARCSTVVVDALTKSQIEMTKTRLESLPKKDRNEVLRIKGLLDSRAPDARQNTVEILALLQRDLARPSRLSPTSLLASRLHALRSSFCDRGVIERLITDNPVHEVRGFRTSARLGYLMNVAGGPAYSGGYDCLHVFDMFLAIATEDRFAVSKFTERFPGPFESGHPSTVLLANAVYCVLAGDRDGFQGLAEKLRTRKESRFFSAMYDCLLGMMAGDANLVGVAMDELLRWNRRQEQLNSAMQKLICIPAHALYNLCLGAFAQLGRTPPQPPTGDTWDAAFHSFVHDAGRGSMPECFDFSGINPVLFQWVHELPSAVAVEALIAAAR